MHACSVANGGAWGMHGVARQGGQARAGSGVRCRDEFAVECMMEGT